MMPGPMPSGPAPLPTSASAMPQQGPPVASPAPQAAKRVARFITAEAAQSTIKPSEDGKLPELHLNDAKDAQPKQAKQGVNPLVILAVVCLSVAFSLIVVLTPESQSGGSQHPAKEDARKQIEDKFFRNLRGEPLKPYQRLLRDATVAHCQGKFLKERTLYRRVLDRLRSERGTSEQGLTGSLTRDKELEGYLNTLLSE